MQSIIDGSIYYTKEGESYIIVTEGTEFNPAEQYYMQSSGIQTLEQYFCHLKDLLDLPNGYKYILLPLDEPPLEINANTREIAIPAAFRTAGLSVEGDELAETLFFRIDRFFDAMDLSTCEIFVQWNLPNDRTYATVISMLDVESEPGKLIFACPITSEITQAAGAVELSVRFIKRGAGDAIVYSFSTKAVKANVSAGLKFIADVQYIEDTQITDLFAAAIENSDMASGEPAPIPVFDEPLGDGGVNVTVQYLTDANNELSVNATANAGTITYEWYQTVRDGSWAKKLATTENGIYTITIEEDPVDITDPDYLNKTKTGTYQVRAVNRLNNKTSKVWSDKVLLPAPEVPQLKALENNIVDTVLTANIDNTDEHAIYEYAWECEDVEGNTSTVGYEASYEAKDPGYYKVTVGSKMNGDIAYASTNTVRITNLPAAVEFAEGYDKDASLIEVNVNENETEIDLSAYVTAPELGAFTSDKIEYHWYIDADTKGVLNENNEVVDEAVDITYNASVPVIKGLDIFNKNTSIRCVAANTLNDKTTLTESVRILVSAKPVE